MSLCWSAINGLTNDFTMWLADTDLACRHRSSQDSATSQSINKISLVLVCWFGFPLSHLCLCVPPASDRFMDQYSVRVEWPYLLRPIRELNRTSPCWETKVLVRHSAPSSWQEQRWTTEHSWHVQLYELRSLQMQPMRWRSIADIHSLAAPSRKMCQSRQQLYKPMTSLFWLFYQSVSLFLAFNSSGNWLFKHVYTGC